MGDDTLYFWCECGACWGEDDNPEDVNCPECGEWYQSGLVDLISGDQFHKIQGDTDED